MAGPALAGLELDYLYAAAEDRFEAIVLSERDAVPDGEMARREARAAALARDLWQRARQRDPQAPAARIEVRFLPERAAPLVIMGRGKILADRRYIASLSDEAVAAAIAHELAHLALAHQRRRLVTGMALLGDATPGRLDQRVRLAMRLSASPVETQIMEMEADAYALGLLREIGVSGSALLEALEALRPDTAETRWLHDIEPRLARLRTLLAAP